MPITRVRMTNCSLYTSEQAVCKRGRDSKAERAGISGPAILGRGLAEGVGALIEPLLLRHQSFSIADDRRTDHRASRRSRLVTVVAQWRSAAGSRIDRSCGVDQE